MDAGELDRELAWTRNVNNLSLEETASVGNRTNLFDKDVVTVGLFRLLSLDLVDLLPKVNGRRLRVLGKEVLAQCISRRRGDRYKATHNEIG